MATAEAIPRSATSNGSAPSSRSPYTVPRLVVEMGHATYDANRLASEGIAADNFLCEVSPPCGDCPDQLAPVVAKLLPIPSGLLGSTLPELWNVLRGKVGALAAIARAGIRWIARKAGGLFGKWLGGIIGALFSPAGTVVGVAIGIGVGCMLGRLACAAM